MKIKILFAIFLVGMFASSCGEKADANSNDTVASENNTTPNKRVLLDNNNNNTATVADTKKADPNAKYPAFTFEETKYEFGDIKQKDIVKHVFKFKNTGEAPLLINDIRTTCGCTTPKYTKEPIAPGAEGEILVQFNSAGKSGMQNKRITILSNVESGNTVITITANVLVTPKNGPYKQK